MFDVDYKPIGGLCSWQSLFESGAESGASSAATEAASSEATMAAENAAMAQSGATAADVVGAGQQAAAAQTAAAAPAFNLPSLADIQQGMQVFNFLKSTGGSAPQPTVASLAPSTTTPTQNQLPGTGSAPTNPADTKGQESWWKGLIQGTGQGDKLPASIQQNIDRQASLVQ